jgi:hypothetical protein
MKEDDMCGACSTHGRDQKSFPENLKERDVLENLSVNK